MFDYNIIKLKRKSRIEQKKLCNLEEICVSVFRQLLFYRGKWEPHIFYHRGTENTEGAQRLKVCFEVSLCEAFGAFMPLWSAQKIRNQDSVNYGL
jgi:hypothetical protein